MQKITSVSELPKWFKDRTYRKQLSDIEWYRAIRIRQYIGDTFELSCNSGHPSQRIANLIMRDPDPFSPLFWIAQHDTPVRDIEANEIAFLRFVISNQPSDDILRRYESLLTKWRDVLKEKEAAGDNGQTPLLCEYEVHLPRFLDLLDDETLREQFHCQHFADDKNDATGNPLLSYGRPLGGYPVIIDTQFDDETIVASLRKILAEKRAQEGIKAKRPFNRNDLDDWEYYKIREVFDLDLWAKANDVNILDRVIASALWPNPSDDFSPIDLLRTTSRKKVKEIFNLDTAVRYFGQMRITHGQNFLDQ